jgi:hypothetical protein
MAVSPIFLATGLLARPKRSRVFFRAGPEKKEGPINAEPQLGSQPRRERLAGANLAKKCGTTGIDLLNPRRGTCARTG